MVLHNPNGKAIEYADGEGLYALNGIRVPAWLIEEPYDMKRIMSEITNTEVRNEAIKLGGPDAIEKALNPTTIEEASVKNGGDYRLYEVVINERKRRYLKGVCPSKGEAFNEAVPPTINTVEQALHWREWGDTPMKNGKYMAPSIRT